MAEVTNQAVAKKSNWNRGLYLGLFFISGCIALALILSVALFQLLSTIITSTQNNNLLKLSKG